MDTSARATGYDLFKLVIAILLLLLFICLLLWIPANVPPDATTSPTSILITATETQPVTATFFPVTPSLTSPSTTATPLPLPSPTETLSSDTSTTTPIPSPTAAQISTLSPTPIPSPTQTSVPQPSPTPTDEPSPTSDTCEAALSRSRLQVGMNSTIIRRLNFRSSPGIQNNWLQTNSPGTQVEIIDGPVCLPHFMGAYVWWQIKLPDGQVGWSAEASLFGRFYFMEPTR